MIISFLKKLDNNIFKIVLYSPKSILNHYQNFIFENTYFDQWYKYLLGETDQISSCLVVDSALKLVNSAITYYITVRKYMNLLNIF